MTPSLRKHIEILVIKFYMENNGDADGNRHPIKNDVVITIWLLSLITPPFDGNYNS